MKKMRKRRFRISLSLLFAIVAASAVLTFVGLNWTAWYRDYQDWSAARAVRSSAQTLFRNESGGEPPAELIHIFGSGHLSHWGRVYDVAITAEQIVSTGADRTLRCWSVETGEELQQLNNGYSFFCGSGSGKLAARLGDDNVLSVYDLKSQPLTLLHTVNLPPESKVRRVYASNVNGLAAFSFADATQQLSLYDVGLGTSAATLELGDVQDFQLAFSEEGMFP